MKLHIALFWHFYRNNKFDFFLAEHYLFLRIMSRIIFSISLLLLPSKRALGLHYQSVACWVQSYKQFSTLKLLCFCVICTFGIFFPALSFLYITIGLNIFLKEFLNFRSPTISQVIFKMYFVKNWVMKIILVNCTTYLKNNWKATLKKVFVSMKGQFSPLFFLIHTY